VAAARAAANGTLWSSLLPKTRAWTSPYPGLVASAAAMMAAGEACAVEAVGAVVAAVPFL